MITISPEHEKQIVREARDKLVVHLITQHKDEMDYISPAQAAGILDVNPGTLAKLPIKKHVIIAGKVVRYKLSDVMEFLKTTRE